jgi:hypothetical protein
VSTCEPLRASTACMIVITLTRLTQRGMCFQAIPKDLQTCLHTCVTWHHDVKGEASTCEHLRAPRSKHCLHDWDYHDLLDLAWHVLPSCSQGLPDPMTHFPTLPLRCQVEGVRDQNRVLTSPDRVEDSVSPRHKSGLHVSAWTIFSGEQGARVEARPQFTVFIGLELLDRRRCLQRGPRSFHPLSPACSPPQKNKHASPRFFFRFATKEGTTKRERVHVAVQTAPARLQILSSFVCEPPFFSFLGGGPWNSAQVPRGSLLGLACQVSN